MASILLSWVHCHICLGAYVEKLRNKGYYLSIPNIQPEVYVHFWLNVLDIIGSSVWSPTKYPSDLTFGWSWFARVLDRGSFACEGARLDDSCGCWRYSPSHFSLPAANHTKRWLKPIITVCKISYYSGRSQGIPHVILNYLHESSLLDIIVHIIEYSEDMI